MRMDERRGPSSEEDNSTPPSAATSGGQGVRLDTTAATDLNRELITASSCGDAEAVRALLSQGAQVSACDDCGFTSVHRAANGAHVEVVKVLIAHGADTRAVSPENAWGRRTPLSIACCNGHLDVIRAILSGRKGQGLPRDAEDIGFTCWHVVNGGDHKVLEVLLTEGADVFMAAELRSFLLRFAAKVGKTACVETLLRHSVDPSLPSDRGATALMLAAESGHLDIVKMLLASGADINVKDNEGRRAVAYASRNGHKDVVGALVSHQTASTSNTPMAHVDQAPANRGSSMDGAAGGAPDDLVPCNVDYALVMLVEAACAGVEAKVDEVLRSSPELDVNALHEGETALMRAVCAGHAGVVRKLVVEYHADPNVVCTEGGRYTCLMHAATNGDEELVRFLLAHGASVHAKDVHSCTVVIHALASGDAAAARSLAVLKAHGADLKAASNKGVTALMIAACAGKMEVVRFLLANGADPTARDGDGGNAIAWAEQVEGNSGVVAVLSEAVTAHVAMLMSAVFRGDEARVDEMLKSWPELDVNGVLLGNTVLTAAVQRRHVGVVRKLLVEYHADPNVICTEGDRCTCLMMAAGKGHEELLHLLFEHGANVHAKDAYGWTAVHRALGSADVVAVRSLELLKRHGGDLTAANNEGVTALMSAAYERQMEVVQYLLANGADPTAKDTRGRDAVAWAKMRRASSEVVAVLSEAVKEHVERLAAQIEGQAKGEAQMHKNRKKNVWSVERVRGCHLSVRRRMRTQMPLPSGGGTVEWQHRKKNGKGQGPAGIWDAQAGGGVGGGVEVTVDATDAGVEGGGDGAEGQQLQQVTAAVAVASLHEGEVEPAAEEAGAQHSATAVAVPADADGVQKVLPPVELTEEDFDDAPTLFECPISHTIMRDPVTACDGYSYERSHIETWIRKAAEDNVALRSPMTNEAMEAGLHRNLVLKFMVDEYLQRKLTEKKARLAAVVVYE